MHLIIVKLIPLCLYMFHLIRSSQKILKSMTFTFIVHIIVMDEVIGAEEDYTVCGRKARIQTLDSLTPSLYFAIACYVLPKYQTTPDFQSPLRWSFTLV